MAHRQQQKSHEDCRRTVCIVCGRKATEKVTESLVDSVRTFVVENYDPEDNRLPSGLCKTDKTVLYEYKKGVYRRDFHIQDFEKYRRYITRSSCESGSCSICNVGRYSLSSLCPISPDLPTDEIKVGRPRISVCKDNSAPKPILLCSKCFSAIGRGKNHACTVATAIHNTISNLSSSSQDQLCSAIIKKRISMSPPASTSNSVSLVCTSGRPLRVTTVTDDQKSINQPELTAEDFSDLQMTNNFSLNQVKSIAQFLRSKIGRQCMEPNLRDNLADISRRLLPFFEERDVILYEKCHSDSSKYIPITRPAVVVNDLKSFIDHVMEQRNYCLEDTLVKVGIDGGQGFFKICLNLISRRGSQSCARSNSKADSGVKGLFVLCIVPNMPESFVNIESCLDEVSLLSHGIEFVLATDLKVANILSGIQSHGASHPCCYCETTNGSWEPAALRTLENIICNYKNWKKNGSKPSEARNFKNCVNSPLLQRNASTDCIIDLIPPPELHLLIGCFNHLFREMQKKWPMADEWPKRVGVVQCGYHGGEFTGGHCNKLLKNVDVLAQFCPLHILPFVRVFRSLNVVVQSCFGANLSQTFLQDISEFAECYQDLGISTTPKVHILCVHVPQFCQKYGPLSLFSEQASESVHSIFKMFWAKRKVNCVTHPKYPKALLDTVVEFNSKHM